MSREQRQISFGNRKVLLPELLSFLFVLLLSVVLLFVVFHVQASGNSLAKPIEAPCYSANIPQHVHRDCMDQEMQVNYNRMEQSMRTVIETVTFTEPLLPGEISDLIKAVLADNPDIFWVSSTYYANLDDEGKTNEIDLSFFWESKEEIEKRHSKYMTEAQAYATQIEKELGQESTQLDKARAIYQLIIRELEYGENEHSQTLQAFFEDDIKETVCTGYARSFQMMCNILGIPCIYAAGSAGEDEDAVHAWNICRLDGIICYVDATWGDDGDVPAIGCYFTANRKAFEENHILAEPSIANSLRNVEDYRKVTSSKKHTSSFAIPFSNSTM